MTERDITSIVAVLSSQMGELKHAVQQSTTDFARRLTAVEEWQIRADERSKALKENREIAKTEAAQHVTFKLSRWQIIVGALTVLVMLAGVIVAVLQAVS